MTVKAIPTDYSGIRFRSRLEARFALMFDRMGVRWKYEPTRLPLADGSEYIPDFWLPDSDAIVEVKGGHNERLAKLRDLDRTGQTVHVCLAGADDDGPYIIWEPYGYCFKSTFSVGCEHRHLMLANQTNGRVNGWNHGDCRPLDDFTFAWPKDAFKSHVDPQISHWLMMAETRGLATADELLEMVENEVSRPRSYQPRLRRYRVRLPEGKRP